MYDKDLDWDPTKKTFFLNEIEPASTTYFVRHLKFDCIPVYGKLYAETARKMKEQMDKNPTAAKRAATKRVAMKAAAKKSAKATKATKATKAKRK